MVRRFFRAWYLRTPGQGVLPSLTKLVHEYVSGSCFTNQNLFGMGKVGDSIEQGGKQENLLKRRLANPRELGKLRRCSWRRPRAFRPTSGKTKFGNLKQGGCSRFVEEIRAKLD